MHSGTLKASGLGSKSFEQVRESALSPRRELDFDCPANHHFSITFSDEAQLPTAWECPTCWLASVRTDGVHAVAPVAKVVRTHWDIVRERRSGAELEELLAERLALLKSGTIGPGVHQELSPAKRQRRTT